jgi:hypothetical protein
MLVAKVEHMTFQGASVDAEVCCPPSLLFQFALAEWSHSSQVEKRWQSLQKKEAQLRVAQHALQAARQDAFLISQSLDEREKRIQHLEQGLRQLMTTAGFLSLALDAP